jgi:hypothetical protein
MSARLEQAYRVYRKRVARCRTENQLNRVHIVAGNYMTPLEMRHFDRALATDPPDSPCRRWIANLRHFMPNNRPRPAEFERKTVLRGLTSYTAHAGTPGKKTLVIGFAGNFHRLMLPTPVFLDCLDPALYDVVILSDYARCAFSRGIPGLGADLLETLSNLPRYFEPAAYRNAIALGTSGGGLPAVLAAIQLRLSRGVSIGGSDFSHFAEKLQTYGMPEAPYLALLASRPKPFPELLFVYSASHAVDSEAALALHERVPSRLLGVRNCDGHLVLAQKLEQGTLLVFLSKLLGQRLERGDPAASSRLERARAQRL